MAEKDTFIQEVDEDYRRDQMLKQWQRFRIPLIVALVALLGGVAGYQIWHAHKIERTEAAARAFVAAQALGQEGKHAEAAQAFASLASGGHDGYGLLAAFQKAGQLLRAKDVTGAVAAYDAIAGNSAYDSNFRDLARYYAALNGLESLPAEEIRRRLGGIPTTSPWNSNARELLALAELKAGDRNQARKLLTELADDAAASPGARGRASELLAALGGPLNP